MAIGSNPLSSTIQSWQTAVVSGFEETAAISAAWRDEVRSALGISLIYAR
jgi:hypothetical protein